MTKADRQNCRSAFLSLLEKWSLLLDYKGRFGLRAEETAEALPAADEARRFRGSGAIGAPLRRGNRSAATVCKRSVSPSGATFFIHDGKGDRSVSRSGATSFSHEGKGRKSSPGPLRSGTPASAGITAISTFFCFGKAALPSTNRSASFTAAAYAVRTLSERTNLPERLLSKPVQRLLWQVRAGHRFKIK